MQWYTENDQKAPMADILPKLAEVEAAMAPFRQLVVAAAQTQATATSSSTVTSRLDRWAAQAELVANFTKRASCELGALNANSLYLGSALQVAPPLS